MATLLAIILATFSISLCVWAAVLFLCFKKETLDKITIFLVSLSAGALTGGAFLHLLPEAAEKIPDDELYSIVLAAFVFSFYGKIAVLAPLPQRKLRDPHFRLYEPDRRFGA
jgi:ZIP Zinc transporter.